VETKGLEVYGVEFDKVYATFGRVLVAYILLGVKLDFNGFSVFILDRELTEFAYAYK